MDINLPLTLGGGLLLLIGGLAKYMRDSLARRLLAVEAHVVSCNLKASNDAVLSYRVNQLEQAVKENHLEVMVRLAEIQAAMK